MDEHFIAKIEIEIYLRPAIVCVRRECVPDASLGEFGVSHHQLAARDAAHVNVFADGPLVPSPAFPAPPVSPRSVSSPRSGAPHGRGSSENKSAPVPLHHCFRRSPILSPSADR